MISATEVRAIRADQYQLPTREFRELLASVDAAIHEGALAPEFDVRLTWGRAWNGADDYDRFRENITRLWYVLRCFGYVVEIQENPTAPLFARTIAVRITL